MNKVIYLIKKQIGEFMKKFKVKIKNLESQNTSVEIVPAENEEQLKQILEQQKLVVLEIIQAEEMALNIPQPDVSKLKDLNIGIDETFVAQVQAQKNSVPQSPQSIAQPPPPPPPQPKIIEFVDNGISYKIENNIVYKKDWVEVDPNKFRIIRKESKKEIKPLDILVYTQEWVELSEGK